MGKKTKQRIDELLHIMNDKSHLHSFLILKKIGIPKCIIKYLFENFILRKKIAVTRLRDIVTFTTNKFISNLEISPIKDEKFCYNFYSDGEVLYTNIKTVVSDALIISHRFSKVYVDSHFTVSTGYVVAKFKPGFTFLQFFLRNIIKLLLNVKYVNTIIAIKNLKIPVFDFVTQRHFNNFCENHSIAEIARIMKIKERLMQIEQEKTDLRRELEILGKI